ncbi:MAG: 30S ribosomal protein S16 [Rickettsiales bacterium]|nr:30S ribosomal protein S16 [Rickettsiales bacterium]
MTTKLRLTRHGSKKRPFYWLVAADVRSARDGSYIEKLGTFNPLLDKDNPERIKLNKDRIEHWFDKGAQPTERVIKLCKLSNIKLPKAIAKKYDAILAKKIAEHKESLEQAQKEAAVQQAAESSEEAKAE